MAKKPTSNKNAGGLHSKKDARQDDLRDERQGAYDPVGNQKVADTNHQTEHERAQTGADVRGEPAPTGSFELPEGLKRPRMDRTIVTEGGTTFRIRCPAPRPTVRRVTERDAARLNV